MYKINFQFEKKSREFAFPVRRTGLQLVPNSYNYNIACISPQISRKLCGLADVDCRAITDLVEEEIKSVQ